MKTVHLTYPHILLEEDLPETVAAIGFFDGIHKGHQAVIQTAVEEAQKRNMKSAVITFHPHPSVILRKNTEKVKYITPLKKKQEVLQQLHIDRLYVIEFNEQLAALKPNEFLDHFITGLHIKHLVAGFDFTFGHKGAGNMNNIADLAQGSFTYTKVNKVELNKEKVSSTKIRQLLSEGNIEDVNRLLGRIFTSDGYVVSGAQRGRTIGFPTANLEIDHDTLLPKPGIYAVKVKCSNIIYTGIVSLGTNPTFTPNKQQLKLEVYILDFDQDIYGELLTIEWHHFIREEKEFASVDLLIEAMNRDVQKTRTLFAVNKKV